MSSSNQHPLAAFRTHTSRSDMRKLAEDHYQHDLLPEDRSRLQTAVSKVSTHASIGSLLGLGLGIFLAYRVRGNRKAMFDALRAHEKPTQVVFKDGRTEAVPDITPMLRRPTFVDVAAYVFFPLSGLFLGGETGLLTGSVGAMRTMSKDPESRKRIEDAFRKFKADVLRKEADELDGGKSVIDKMF